MPAISAKDADLHPWRLARLARAFAEALDLAQRHARRLNKGLISPHDHEGDLTATWQTKAELWSRGELVKSAWESTSRMGLCR
jgi:hypothetical protein